MCLCPSNCALCDGGRRKNHSCRTTEVYTVHNTSSSRVVLDQAALKAKPEKETEMLGPRTRGCRIIQHRRGCGSVSDIPPCCAESHAEGKASARRVERQLDERPSLAALSFAPHRVPRRAASSFTLPGARGKASARHVERQLDERPAALRDKQEALRQGLRTPRRAATRRAASSFAPPGLEARPPHAASSGNSASGLKLRPARLRGKASARRVERQLGERPRASPRPASRQGLRTPLQAAARRAASSFPPTGLETRTLHDEPSGSSASGLEIHPARLRDKTAARHVERQLGERHRASPRPASSRARRPASSFPPPGIEARPLQRRAMSRLPVSATGLELPPARDRGKASARRVERQLGEQPRAELRPASRQGLRTPRRAAARRAASSISPPGIEARPLHAASSDSSASSLELRPAQLQAVQGRARTACYTTKETSSARQRHPYGPPAPFHAFRLPAPADPL
eukprot:tig00020796_g13717.t2